MKKILIILATILLMTTLLFAFAGCGESFSKNSIMSQIDNNLKWHQGGTEICTYDVSNKAGDKLGTYTTTMQFYKSSVEIITSNESVKPKLNNFEGYKFTSKINATLDGQTFVQETESYASRSLEPKLSYVKTVENDQTIEIVTEYEQKKSNVTFINDGKVSKDSDKYSKSAFVVDNAFLYQFARATTLSSALTIVVPNYNTTACNTQNVSYTCSYANAGNIKLDTEFVLKKSFNQTITSGEISGDTSGEALPPINSGFADNSGDITSSDADASGNVTLTYPNTLTSSIPVVKCTFSTTKTFPASGSISCFISSYDMKMKGDENFASRVVVRFQEGDITYNLTSIIYTSPSFAG